METLAVIAASYASFAASLASLADSIWQSPIFAKDTWSALTKSLRVALTFGGAALILYEWRSRRLGQRIRQRTQRKWAIAFTVIAFFTYFDFFNPNVRYHEYYHRHEFYHYYLGSKYNREVGYTRLYECTAVAEIENGRGASIRNREIRDLSVNLIKPMKDTYVLTKPELCKQHFSKERWEAFKKDVNWFYTAAAGSYWENMQKDHGYNPPPVWTMTGKFFASFGDAGDKFFKVLAGLDVMFHLGTVLLIGWAFGPKVMAVATVFWACNAPANFYWTGGAFMRQDWLFFLVASVCLARKRMFMLSGGALTWAALLRVFPLILFFGWGVIILIHIIKKIRGTDPDSRSGKPRQLIDLLHPDHRRLIGGCLLACAVLIPASVAVTGTHSYPEFVKHISVHKNTPLTNHMGLETMLVHTWDGRMRFGQDDNLDDPFQGWKQGRLDRFEQRKPLYYLIVAFVVGWIAWALRRTKLLWVGVPLSLPLVISLLNLTCYYYSMFIVAPLLIRARPTLAPALLATSGASALLLYGPQTGYYWVDDRFTAQSWLFYTMGLLLLFAYSRPFSLARLKAFWENRPEPKRSPPPEAPPRSLLTG